ncbi:MAG TPA: hypothetical protein EYP21_08365 [Syntrophaceae bacterium]|nr:hypothetical protein [Syntrophaceae bacterium]
MKKVLLGIGVIALFFVVSSCGPQKYTAEHYSYETECLGVEMDGSQTLKVWGKGITRKDAVEQAKKEAVNDVLFKGIRKGSSDCNLKPVILESNARENHEAYFNRFFADGGEYLNYVSGESKRLHKQKVKHRRKTGNKTYSIIVRVQRSELRQKMLTDIINK